MAMDGASSFLLAIYLSVSFASGARLLPANRINLHHETSGHSLCKVEGPSGSGLTWNFGTDNCRMACTRTIFTQGKINSAFAEKFVATKENGACHCRDKHTGKDKLPPHRVLARCGNSDCWEYYRNAMAKVVDLPATNFWTANHACPPCGGPDQPRCDETFVDRSFGEDDLSELEIAAQADSTGEKQKELDIILDALSDLNQGIQKRPTVQKARIIEETVETLEKEASDDEHENVQLTPEEVQERVREDHPEIGRIVITQDMVSSAEESVLNVDHFAQQESWRDPDSLVPQVKIPRPNGYWPSHDPDPADRHTYLSHLDAVLTEAAFMEHEETREEWEKHAILCEQGFSTASGQTMKQDEMYLDEDITQTYEGDSNTRLGTLNGKVELIFHHPRHSGLPPAQMFEFECKNCKHPDRSSWHRSLGQMLNTGESLEFTPKGDSEVLLAGTGLAQLAAPGLFSYSFNYDRSSGSGDAEIQPGAAAKGVSLTVEQSEGKVTGIKVSGKLWESSTPDTIAPEQHAYHCQAAMLNRHRKKISITTPSANIPVFPNMLGDFEVEALEHDESTEEAAFLKVTVSGCGPCAHTVRAFNDNVYGLQEVNGNGEPCSQKSDGTCPPIGSSYGTWYFTTKKFERDVKPMLDVVNAEMEMSRENASSELNHGVYWDLQELIARIRDQELKFPFNHKLERMQMNLQKCTIVGSSRVSCSPTETRYMHDAMLMHNSAEKMMIEYLKASPSDKAPPYGVLEPDGTRQGLSFKAYDAALKGGINWHVALVKYGQCTPAMQEWLFVGMGSDSAVDLDLGLVFWQRRGNTVVYKDHLNYVATQAGPSPWTKFRRAVEYSGDNRNGAGEGDDEWMALNLRSLRQQGIDYITVHVNIYSGGSFSQLEGAFLRFVEVDESAKPVTKTMDPKTERQFRVNTRHPMEDGKTVQYMDLDAAKGRLGNAKAGLMTVLFTSPDTQKALPLESMFSMPQGEAHFQIVQVGKAMSSQSLHNATSQREINDWWSKLQETTLEDKATVMRQEGLAVDAYELGQETREADLLNELPGGRDPLSNEIAVEEVRVNLPVLLTPLDKELEEQTVHMSAEDKYILEDSQHGVCIHMRQGIDLQPTLFMDSHCGVGGNAIEWRLQMGDNGGTIPQADVDKCMAPSSTGVVMSSECEAEWKFVPVHGGGYNLQQTTSRQCLGYAVPQQPSDIVMVACNSPQVAKLHKMPAIKGLFDNLLVEFPGGPPGTDSLCIKNR